MKYHIKKKYKIEGPYTKEELIELLGSLSIGVKTLCKREEDSNQDFKPLVQLLPDVIETIEERRSKKIKKRSGNFIPNTDHILVTTETFLSGTTIKERLGVISSESALGMNLIRDIFTNVRDVVGGKSVSTQKVLRDLKENAIKDLKNQAFELGANAIIGIDLDYSEFSGSGRSMLFLVISGTAVIIEKDSNS